MKLKKIPNLTKRKECDLRHISEIAFKWSSMLCLLQTLISKTGRDGRDGTIGAKVGNFFCLTALLLFYQRQRICNKPKPTRLRIWLYGAYIHFNTSCIDSLLPWLLSDIFQGEKGDTGLRGLNGNAGVKVGRTVLVT